MPKSAAASRYRRRNLWHGRHLSRHRYGKGWLWDNKVSARTTLTTIDEQAPARVGVRDLAVLKGDTIDYLEHVTAQGEQALDPVMTVDTGDIDLKTPGSYSVVYTIVDFAGNQSSQPATVTVLGAARTVIRRCCSVRW